MKGIQSKLSGNGTLVAENHTLWMKVSGCEYLLLALSLLFVLVTKRQNRIISQNISIRARVSVYTSYTI